MKLLNYLFFNMFGSVLECCELSPSSVSMLTEIDKQTGKILFEMKHIDALERACRGDI